MPGFDGTGPLGQGSRTGGGFGFCPPGTAPASGYYGAWPGYGAGRGGVPRGGGRGRAWGGGRGRGWYGYPPYPYAGGAYPYGPAPTPKEEIDMLRSEAEVLDQQMEEIQNRIKTLEKTETQGPKK